MTRATVAEPAPSPAAARHARFAEVVRFGLAGALNTAFGFGVYSVLVLAGSPVSVALLIATVTGVFFNFLTFGALAFRRLQARRLPRFLAVYGAIYLFNLALLEGLRAGTGWGPIAAQLACILVVAPSAYVLLKASVFRHASDE
jgi:putative flippase GtrA